MSTANQCATVAQIDLDNLEALARAATPGPWRQCVGTGATEVRGEPAGGQSSPRVSRILRSDPNAEENAAFIEAANPAAVLALIEQDRAKDVEIADLGAQLARQRQGDVAELDWLKYDAAIDALEIHGIRYATALFTEFASSLPEGQALKFVGRENGVVCLERISSPTLGSAPQALRGVRWDLFPGYLIDHHEGDTITEEGLQFAAAGMLKDEQYIAALATQPQQAAERAGVPDEIALLGGGKVRREARQGGRHGWLLYGTEGKLIRGLTAHEQKFIDSALACAPIAQQAGAQEGEQMEPVEGDLLPPIGSKVLIHLASRDALVEHTVAGYYVWGALSHQVKDGEKNAHRVFVRIRDTDGYLNARSLSDVRPAVLATSHQDSAQEGGVA